MMTNTFKILLLLSAVLFSGKKGLGQHLFFDTISVNFEKTVSVWSNMKEFEPEWFEMSKNSVPSQTLSYFNFTGTGKHSIYQHVSGPEIPAGKYFTPIAERNRVYNNYEHKTTISYKEVYEQSYLVQDSLLNIKWKFTADTRNIAGFDCRKVVGILWDTVAVFAFYTDELTVPGGPEGITGLPGMILGVGIPAIHTTWFATSVTVNNVAVSSIKPIQKGKKINRVDMNNAIKKATGRWGRLEQLMFAI